MQNFSSLFSFVESLVVNGLLETAFIVAVAIFLYFALLYSKKILSQVLRYVNLYFRVLANFDFKFRNITSMFSTLAFFVIIVPIIPKLFNDRGLQDTGNEAQGSISARAYSERARLNGEIDIAKRRETLLDYDLFVNLYNNLDIADIFPVPVITRKNFKSSCPIVTESLISSSKGLLKDCRVTDSGYLTRLGLSTYFYAKYSYFLDNADAFLISVVVYQSINDATDLKPVITKISYRANHGLDNSLSYTFDDLQVSKVEDGRALVMLSDTSCGSSCYQEVKFYFINEDFIKYVNVKPFYDEIEKRFMDIGYVRDITIDGERMVFDGTLYLKDDPNCCPSGGKIEGTLLFDADAISIYLSSFDLIR